MSSRRTTARAAIALLVSTLTSTALIAGPAHADTVVGTDLPATSTGTLGHGFAPGTPVTRAQAVGRAQDWATNQVPYGTTGWWSDAATGGQYRQDGAGLVSMAWELPSSLTDTTLQGVATKLAGVNDLKPGDAILSNDNIRAELFVSWTDAAHDSANVISETQPGTPTQASVHPGFDLTTGGWTAWRYSNLRISGAANEVGGSGRIRWADFTGSGRADYCVINDDGSVRVFQNNGGDGHGGWTDLGIVATGLTTDRSRVRLVDFTGSGRADYVLINPDGSVRVFANKGGDGRGGWQDLGIVATGLTTNPDQVRFADFTGMGRADYILTNADGSVDVFANNGGDGRGGWTNLGQVATGLTTDRSRVRWEDFDGDGKADYTVINPDGSVHVFSNQGGDGHGGWTDLGQVAAGLTTSQDSVSFADFNGDGKADYILGNPSGGPVTVYANNGGDTGGGWINLGQVAAGA